MYDFPRTVLPLAGRGKKSGNKKDRPRRTGLSVSRDAEQSEILVRGVGGLVEGVLGGFLGIAHRLLALALHFLHRAFALQAIVVGGLANALLGLADGFVGGAFDLVCRATHGTLLQLFQLRKGNAPMRRMFP